MPVQDITSLVQTTCRLRERVFDCAAAEDPPEVGVWSVRHAKDCTRAKLEERNQRQETAFTVQIVLRLWFLVFEFGL